MESDVKDHYNSEKLLSRIEKALQDAGKSLDDITPKDLSPIDQLHTGGAPASMGLFKKAGLQPDSLVLDAGCGLGGSSRLLAKEFHCRVEGIDLADRFVETAVFLTRATRLDRSVSFRQGSVLDLPFKTASFDAVLCQHILMNIKDKSQAIKEFFRVLKPGGQLILHEITAGKNKGLLLPVPWAQKDTISFLEPWDTLSGYLLETGFEPVSIQDDSDAACAWWEKVRAVPFRPVHALGPGLIFGDNARHFGKNMYENFSGNSICLIEAIVKKRYDG